MIILTDSQKEFIMLSFETTDREDWTHVTDHLKGVYSYHGKLNCTYNQLVNLFGQPAKPVFDDDKVYTEWFLLGSKNKKVVEAVSVYDWKLNPRYLGKKLPENPSFKDIHGYTEDEVIEWHVCARNDKEAGELIKYIEEQ